MFDINDIYQHLLNGGNKQDLYACLERDIAAAEKKVKATKEAEKKEKELADKINKTRSAAFKALKDYLTLVNPDITEDIINSVLDTLESVKIKVNDEEWKVIWNTFFPFNFKRK